MNEYEEQAVSYIMEGKCEKVGFGSYRLGELNALDALYALSILNLLHINFKDESTVAYLKSLQNIYGSYSIIYSTFYGGIPTHENT